MARECRFCGGNASEPDHRYFCDGQQGAVEADEAEPSPFTAPRETSVQAFYEGIASGAFLNRRQQIWKGLAQIPRSTANEIFRHLGIWFDTSNNIRTRLTELRDLGLVREVGERVCSVTGKTCIIWEVVPPDEWVGEAVKDRCPTCHQVVSRHIPKLRQVS